MEPVGALMTAYILPLKPGYVISSKFTPSRGGHYFSNSFLKNSLSLVKRTLQRRAVMSPSGGGEPRRICSMKLQGEDIA